MNLMDLFPLEVEVTPEILRKANIYDCENCIGALALKSALPKNTTVNVRWGVFNGRVWDGQYGVINLTTEGCIDVTDITEPCKITFIVA